MSQKNRCHLIEMPFFGVYILLSVDEFVEGEALITARPLVHHAVVEPLLTFAHRALEILHDTEVW